MKHSNSFLIGAVGAPAPHSDPAGPHSSPAPGHTGSPASKVSGKQLSREEEVEKNQPGQAGAFLFAASLVEKTKSLVRGEYDTPLSEIPPQKRRAEELIGLFVPLGPTAPSPQAKLSHHPGRKLSSLQTGGANQHGGQTSERASALLKKPRRNGVTSHSQERGGVSNFRFVNSQRCGLR